MGDAIKCLPMKLYETKPNGKVFTCCVRVFPATFTVTTSCCNGNRFVFLDVKAEFICIIFGLNSCPEEASRLFFGLF
jgi:hypothetical protein